MLGDAYDGIASRTGAGEYLLLRDREASFSTLLAKLGAAAESRSIPQSQLGLEANSLQLSTLEPNFSPASIRRAVDNLRHPERPVRQWEGVEMKQPLWLRPAVVLAGLAAIGGIAWLVL